MTRLYTYWRSSAAYRVRIALNLKGISYDAQSIHLARGDQKQDDYKKINAQGLVPALVLDDGDILTQSLAIIEYLDETVPEPRLLPGDAKARAHIRSLALVVACDIHPLNNLRVLKYLKNELGQEQAAIDVWYRHWIADGLQAMESQAKDHGGRFLCGDAPTLADVCLVPQLYNARRFDCDLSPFPRLLAAEQACAELDAFRRAAPEAQPDAQP